MAPPGPFPARMDHPPLGIRNQHIGLLKRRWRSVSLDLQGDQTLPVNDEPDLFVIMIAVEKQQLILESGSRLPEELDTRVLGGQADGARARVELDGELTLRADVKALTGAEGGISDGFEISLELAGQLVERPGMRWFLLRLGAWVTLGHGGQIISQHDIRFN